jgi:hypothetical protein
MSGDVLLWNGTRIPACMLRAIMSATCQDLVFTSSKMEVHSMSREEKTGFTLAEVRGARVPHRLPLAYVKAQGERGTYYYVVNGLASPQEFKEYVLDSEEAARRKFLVELQTYLGEQTGT